jgi:tetratricopeptide (TPR) repeat protein
LLAALLLAGCVSTGGNVPVTDSGSPQKPRISKPATDDSAEEPAQLVIAPPRSSGAQTLLAQANDALDNQRPSTAIVLLERAIRIEPREALLWIKLSEVHLSQRDDINAFQHARKAIALAGSDANKTAAAWLQLAKVYEVQGKTREARQIRQRHSRARG